MSQDLEAQYCVTLYNGHVECERAELCRTIAKFGAEMEAAKADRNSFDASHKREVVNVLRLEAENAKLRADNKALLDALKAVLDCCDPEL